MLSQQVVGSEAVPSGTFRQVLKRKEKKTRINDRKVARGTFLFLAGTLKLFLAHTASLTFTNACTLALQLINLSSIL
jgi:hypothetical protein